MEQTNKKSLPTNKTFHIFLPNIITCSYSPTIIIYHDFCKIRSETTNVHSSGDRALCACYCVWCGWQRRKKINLFIYFYHVFFYIFLFCILFSSSQQLNLDIFHENPVFLFSFLSRQHSCGANIWKESMKSIWNSVSMTVGGGHCWRGHLTMSLDSYTSVSMSYIFTCIWRFVVMKTLVACSGLCAM